MKSTYLQIARIFTSIGLILGALACIVILGFSIKSIFTSNPSDSNLVTLEIPLKIQSENNPSEISFIDEKFKAKRIEYDHVGLEVYPANNIPLTQALIYLASLIYVFIIVLIFYQLFRILDDFTNPFKPKNIRRVRNIGFFVLATEVYRICIAVIINLTVGQKVQIENAEVIPFSLTSINLPVLFLAVIIITLSHVFKHGMVLQEYENQTV